MNKVAKTIFGLAAGFVFATNTYANIVDQGSYLTDTSSNLDWLDVTETFGKSYDYVNSQFGVVGLYAGWRYATGDEFNTLLSNFTGTTITGYGVVNQETDLIDGLVLMLGNYASFANVYYAAGFISDTPQTSSNRYLAGICDNDNQNAQCMLGAGGQDVSVAHLTDVSPSYAQHNIGSFLVRAAVTNVPEPTTTTLIGLGIAAMTFRRRKYKFQTIDVCHRFSMR